MEEIFFKYFNLLVFVIDSAAVVVVVWGTVIAFLSFVKLEISKKKVNENNFLEEVRAHIGQKLLLGLELFLAGDLVRVVISPTMSALTNLAIIVVIRTVLSFFLNLELKEIKKK